MQAELFSLNMSKNFSPKFRFVCKVVGRIKFFDKHSWHVENYKNGTKNVFRVVKFKFKCVTELYPLQIGIHCLRFYY